MSKKDYFDEKFNRIDERFNSVEKDIKEIKDNHLAHLGINLEGVMKDIEWLKQKKYDSQESKDDIKTQQDVDWLKRFFWVGVGAIISSFISLMATIIHILMN